jgi:16S rRNA (guanine1207-N2)-methyltransferase
LADHYYSEIQNSPFNPFLITIRNGLEEFELFSASGIFSLKHLDKGTEVLLKFMDASGSVCDLGCGYGVVGITVLRRKLSDTVTFLDANKRAIQLVKRNLELHKFKGQMKVSDVFSKMEDSFDTILTNPPYSAGRAVCLAFIDQSKDHLNKGGSLQLVCRRQKGGDVLEKYMESSFGNVEIIGQKSGFRVYKSVKN